MTSSLASPAWRAPSPPVGLFAGQLSKVLAWQGLANGLHSFLGKKHRKTDDWPALACRAMPEKGKLPPPVPWGLGGRMPNFFDFA
jgi:hypothetical protein